jgi:hypothetical protein
MSLFYYGVIILGMVLGGMLFLLLFSLLAMAQKGDECLEQMEIEMRETFAYAPSGLKSEKCEDLRVSATSDLSHGGTT